VTAKITGGTINSGRSARGGIDGYGGKGHDTWLQAGNYNADPLR